MTRYVSRRTSALKVAMLVANPGTGDARVMKEAESLVAAGHEVTVFCLAAAARPAEEVVDGVRYVRLKEWHRRGAAAAGAEAAGATGAPSRQSLLGRAKAAIAPFLQHELHAATFVAPVATFCPGIIHAHDFETLPAAVRAAGRCGARVVYDMHELEEGRLPAPNALLRLWKSEIERLALRQVSATITVSPSIARYKAAKYNIPEPTVVLNAPRLGNTAAAAGLRARCGLGPQTPLAVYVGLVTEGRGIEALLAALHFAPHMHLAVLGPVRPAFRPLLEREAAALGGRLHVLAPVPHDQVVAHIADADFGVATIPGSCLSYEFCLPNKLFEMTFAGLPVLVSNTTEMSRFVAETGTGHTVDAADPAAIAVGLDAVYAARTELRPTPSQLDTLRARFGWQRQAANLIDVYEAVANGPRGLPVAMARRALTAAARPAGALTTGI